MTMVAEEGVIAVKKLADKASPVVYNGVQCLRFIAALLVVVFHATYYTNERLSSTTSVWSNGGLGVDIFFIISGFVMGITAKRFERPGGWRDFALRRLVRVMPLYWLATTAKLVVLLFAPALALHSTLDWGYIAKSYLLIPASASDGTVSPFLAVGWTLLFEMFFYLVFAIALALRVNITAFCGCVLIGCAVGSVFKPDNPPAYMMYLNPIVLEFLVGLVFSTWIRLSVQHIGTAVSLCGIGIALIIAWPIFPLEFGEAERMIGPAFLVLGVVGLERHVHRFPEKLVFLGAASYSLYLTHPLVAPLAPAVLARLGLIWPASAVLLCIALAIVTAVGVFGAIEKPMLTCIGRRLGTNAAKTARR